MPQPTPTLHIQRRHFILRHVNCGKCKACRAGRPHGPYFYERIRKGRGNWTERYVGAYLPQAIATKQSSDTFKKRLHERGRSIYFY